MNEIDFIASLAEVMEISPDDLAADTVLAELSQWDSTAVIGFMAFCDEQYGKIIRADQIARCLSVADLLELVENSESLSAE